MEFKIIEVGTPEYDKMVDLRKRVLKDPFDIPFTPEEVEEDKESILLGGFAEDGSILSCSMLVSMDNTQTAKLRQMAVDFLLHKQGLGRQMMVFSEKIASQKDFETIYLHARKPALGFYQKQGYEALGDEFVEVGIPHFAMQKKLK